MSIEIRVPTLGESVTEATVGKWFKKSGEAVNADEPLVELETDKVTVEVPAPSSGVLGEILVDSGSTVAVGNPKSSSEGYGPRPSIVRLKLMPNSCARLTAAVSSSSGVGR